MILNNYKMLFVTGQTGSQQMVRNMAGGNTYTSNTQTSKMICAQSSMAPGDIMTLSGGYYALDIGFGDTPETADDYVLADGNLGNRKLTYLAYGNNSAGVGDIINTYLNVRNDGAANVTVKEIGYYGNPTSTGSSSGGKTILFLRKVFDNPVTIAPGETYSFNYVLKFKNT